jgi:hypothetical protein
LAGCIAGAPNLYKAPQQKSLNWDRKFVPNDLNSSWKNDGDLSNNLFPASFKINLFAGAHMLKYAMALFFIASFSSCVHLSPLSQERNHFDDTNAKSLSKPDSVVSWKTQVRIPKIGDIWKYKGTKKYHDGSIKYTTFTVTAMVEVNTYVPSDNSDIYGCPAFKVVHTRHDGSVWVEPDLHKTLFSKDYLHQNSINVSDATDAIVQLYDGHPRILYIAPFSIGLNCMNEYYSPLLGKMTEMNFVTQYFDSVKVIAGVFHRVWEIHVTVRANMSVETSWDEYVLYAEGFGMIKKSIVDHGKIVPILELASYKLKK